MKVALIQLKAGNNKAENLRKAVYFIEKAASKKAKFILLPELFIYKGGLLDQVTLKKISEPLFGETLSELSRVARSLNCNILAGSIYEKIPNRKKVYNSSVFLDSAGKKRAVYRKINLFDAVIGKKKIKESNYFKKGNEISLVKTNGFKIGLSICYDLRFPELYRKYSRTGLDVVCVPSAFTYKTGQSHWETLLRARAIENLCYVLAPNQIGEDSRGIKYYGNSMIVSPWGEVLSKGSLNKEEIIFGNIAMKELNEKRSILSFSKTNIKL